MRLEGCEPLVAGGRDGHVAQCPCDSAAVAVPDPAEFGKKQATVRFVKLDLAKLRIPKAVAAPFLLERRVAGAAVEEILESLVQIFQCPLQGLGRCCTQPWRCSLALPLREVLAHHGIGNVLATTGVACYFLSTT